MLNNAITALVILGIIALSIKMYLESDAYNLRCIISGVDGNKYCVRERKRMNEAADLLAEVTRKCKMLVFYVKEKYPDQERVKRLVDGFNPDKINETLPTSELTAYSENKGEKIAFCLNKNKKTKDTRLIDLDTLTFVAIHELAHIMTVSIGHKAEFWGNMKFLLQNAKEAKIHEPKDYKKDPEEYCGMTISDNPYYDM